MAFLEDPRLRQRWNQIAHDAEAVTENAAAGIWSFQHNYINPCFGSVASSLQQCTAVCLGDPEERLRRRRERERMQAEYTFDFYDDWYEDEERSNGGLLGNWGGEDWDRLLAGTGSSRRHGAETNEQPRRKRGMSYGTRGARRKTNEQDPTIIPSTQAIGFLGRLPWKMGGTLRYKPSAADLQDHPGRHGTGESEPLLGPNTDAGFGELPVTRKRSGTTGSGETSDSYRSRGDLFPSDGEGEEDAVPLDDEVTYDMVRKDDRSSGRSRSFKGKRPVGGFSGSRTVSRTTLGSTTSEGSPVMDRTSTSLPSTPHLDNTSSLKDLEMEEARLRLEEDEEIAKKKEAATQLAAQRGLGISSLSPVQEPKLEVAEEEGLMSTPPLPSANDDETVSHGPHQPDGQDLQYTSTRDGDSIPPDNDAFVPARLPNFG